MILQDELDARRAEAGAVYLDRIEAAAMMLEQAGMPLRCKQVGDLAPDFALADHDGELVALSGILQSGYVVISFFRGEWCPFCQAELDALLKTQPNFARLGAVLLLISPEQPSDRLRAEVRRLGTQVRLMRDPKLGAALLYGLVHLVPGLLRDYYLGRGFDLSRELSTGSWLLPLPADFVIGPDQVIFMSYAESNFTRRLDPTIIVEALECLRGHPDLLDHR
jgi:peroxiredoxin